MSTLLWLGATLRSWALVGRGLRRRSCYGAGLARVGTWGGLAVPMELATRFAHGPLWGRRASGLSSASARVWPNWTRVAPCLTALGNSHRLLSVQEVLCGATYATPTNSWRWYLAPRTTGRATCSRPLTTVSPQRKGMLRLGEHRPCRYQVSGDGRRHYSHYTLAGVTERLVLDGRSQIRQLSTTSGNWNILVACKLLIR